MKRLPALLGLFAVLVLGYIALRWYSQPADFQAPEALRFESFSPESADEVRLVFADGKQISLDKHTDGWKINDLPADASKVEGVLNSLADAEVTSRVSGNSQYHERFEVDGKGVKMTVLEGDQVKAEFIVGKTAGGDAVYVRLPEQDDVYVMSGLQRYALNEDPSLWRERKVASFQPEQVRRINYSENQIQWSLVETTDGWTLGTNRIAAAPVDADKVETFLRTVANLGAVDFPSKEEVETARNSRSTFATAVLEIGSVETFERKETWFIYAGDADSYLIVRESDGVGYNVPLQNVDDAFSDYGAMKTKFTLTEAEKAAANQPESDK